MKEQIIQRCEELKEGKTFLVRKILEEIKQEAITGVPMKPAELTKIVLTSKQIIENKIEENKQPKGNISKAGYDMDLCPF